MTDFEQNKRLKKIIEEGFGLTAAAFSRKYNDPKGVKTYNIITLKSGLSKKMLSEILRAYPSINEDWLLTGEGDMFKTTTTGSGNIVQAGIVNGNNHQVSSSCEVSRLVSIIEAKDRQIDKLIELLSKKEK